MHNKAANRRRGRPKRSSSKRKRRLRAVRKLLNLLPLHPKLLKSQAVRWSPRTLNRRMRRESEQLFCCYGLAWCSPTPSTFAQQSSLVSRHCSSHCVGTRREWSAQGELAEFRSIPLQPEIQRRHRLQHSLPPRPLSSPQPLYFGIPAAAAPAAVFHNQYRLSIPATADRSKMKKNI